MTVGEYLRAELIDEINSALSAVSLGQGEVMFAEIDLPSLGFRVTEYQATNYATHIVLGRQFPPATTEPTASTAVCRGVPLNRHRTQSWIGAQHAGRQSGYGDRCGKKH